MPRSGPRRPPGANGSRARVGRSVASTRWSRPSANASRASSTPCGATTRIRWTPCGREGRVLEQLRQDRHTTEQRLDAVRNRTRALDLETNEVSLRSEALHEHIARELGAEPADLADLPVPELPEGTSLAEHAAELERKLAALGPVNPLALEELSTLEERHKELEAQVDDVRGRAGSSTRSCGRWITRS